MYLNIASIAEGAESASPSDYARGSRHSLAANLEKNRVAD